MGHQPPGATLAGKTDSPSLGSGEKASGVYHQLREGDSHPLNEPSTSVGKRKEDFERLKNCAGSAFRRKKKGCIRKSRGKREHG